jgi:hypothetical protein
MTEDNIVEEEGTNQDLGGDIITEDNQTEGLEMELACVTKRNNDASDDIAIEPEMHFNNNAEEEEQEEEEQQVGNAEEKGRNSVQEAPEDTEEGDKVPEEPKRFQGRLSRQQELRKSETEVGAASPSPLSPLQVPRLWSSLDTQSEDMGCEPEQVSLFTSCTQDVSTAVLCI